MTRRPFLPSGNRLDSLLCRSSALLTGPALLCILTAAPALADASDTPLGSEFAVNTYTVDDQLAPAIAFNGSHFLVVWHGDRDPGSGAGIAGRLIDTDGMPVGVDLEISSPAAGIQSDADVAPTAAGGFLVVWQSDAGGDFDIVGRAFDSAGSALATEMLISSYATGNQTLPRVAFDDTVDGDFLVVWQTDTSLELNFGAPTPAAIVSRRLDSSGTPLASDMVVRAASSDYPQKPAVAALPGAGFVVAWQTDFDGLGGDVAGRLVSSTGTPVGGIFLVNSITTDDQVKPSIAADDDGDFVVAWESDYTDDGLREIRAQGFDSGGTPVGTEILISAEEDSYEQTDPAVIAALDDSSEFTFLWRDDFLPSPWSLGSPIFIRSRGASGPPFSFSRQPEPFLPSVGAPLSPIIDLNTAPFTAEVSSPAAVEGNGFFLAVWQGEDGSSSGIRARRVGPKGFLFGDGFEDGTTDAWTATNP